MPVQELSQWRAQKTEEALKMSVLDDVTAAQFSTAAAAAARDKLVPTIVKEVAGAVGATDVEPKPVPAVPSTEEVGIKQQSISTIQQACGCMH